MREKYKPLGMPKVKLPKQPKVEIKQPKHPKKPRVTILDRRIY